MAEKDLPIGFGHELNPPAKRRPAAIGTPEPAKTLLGGCYLGL